MLGGREKLERRVLLAEMKVVERSTADMWMGVLARERMEGWERRVVVRTRGPQALSRMRMGFSGLVSEFGGGR